MWGQGLREDEKFSSRVKCWLQEKTNAKSASTQKHSGAVISVGPATQPIFTAGNGEVNLPTPSINEQLDHTDPVL
jgi:hypothetical protein